MKTPGRNRRGSRKQPRCFSGCAARGPVCGSSSRFPLRDAVAGQSARHHFRADDLAIAAPLVFVVECLSEAVCGFACAVLRDELVEEVKRNGRTDATARSLLRTHRIPWKGGPRRSPKRTQAFVTKVSTHPRLHQRAAQIQQYGMVNLILPRIGRTSSAGKTINWISARSSAK
jgi:hypothetical protein